MAAGSGAVFALTRYCAAQYRRVLVYAVVALLLAAPGILKLNLQLDGRALVPLLDPAVATDLAVRETFAQHEQIVLFIESPGPGEILDVESLRRISDLTFAIFDYEEIEAQHLMSLASEGRDRVESMDYSPFLSPLPETREEIESLRADIDAAALVKGTLVAPDYSGATILVQVPPGVDRLALYRKIEATVASTAVGDDRIHIVGAPVAEGLLGRHLLADLARLLPLCCLTFAVALWFAFKRPWAIAVVMMHVGACLIFTFGMIGWTGQPVYITTAILPVVLCTVAMASEIHMVAAAQRSLRERSIDAPEFVLASMREIQRPLTLTVLTTAIGFVSFVLSDLTPVRSFGLWATLGTLFSLIWSLCFSPALYTALGAARIARGSAASSLIGGVLNIFDRTSRSRLTFPIVGILFVLLCAGTLRLQMQDGWISGFAEGSTFRNSVECVNRSVLGTHLLQVELDFGSATGRLLPPFQNPAVIDAVRRFELMLRAVDGVGGVIGPYSQLSTTNYLVRARVPGSEVVDADSTELRRLWRRMEFARGKHRRQEVVNDAMQKGLLTIFLKNANYQQTAEIMTSVRNAADELFTSHAGSIKFAGDVAISQAAIKSNVRGQLMSIGFGIASLLIFLLLVLRRVSLALFAVAPVVAASVAVLGAMGWLGIPVGIATSMFIAITLGIGVDFGLHLIERIERERAAGSTNPVARARAKVGPAIITDCFVIGAGFGLLALSQVPANARLGALVAFSVLTSCLCTLLLARDRAFAPGGGHAPTEAFSAPVAADRG